MLSELQEARRVPQAEYIEINRNEAVREEFHVTDAKSADWVARRIIEARQRVTDAETRLEEIKKEAERDIKFFEDRYGFELQEFAKCQIQGKKGKSVKLATSTIGFRSTPAKLEVVDEQALRTWAEKNLADALVKVEKITLSKSAVNVHWETTGELPDGCALKPEHETFYVK